MLDILLQCNVRTIYIYFFILNIFIFDIIYIFNIYIIIVNTKIIMSWNIKTLYYQNHVATNELRHIYLAADSTPNGQLLHCYWSFPYYNFIFLLENYLFLSLILKYDGKVQTSDGALREYLSVLCLQRAEYDDCLLDKFTFQHS